MLLAWTKAEAEGVAIEKSLNLRSILDRRSTHTKDNLYGCFKVKLSVSGEISIRIDTEDRADIRKIFDIVKKNVFKMFITIHVQVPPTYTYKQ